MAQPQPIDAMTRAELTHEFRRVIAAARRRGYTGTADDLFGRWIEFRRAASPELAANGAPEVFA